MDELIQENIGIIAPWTNSVGVLLAVGAVGGTVWALRRRSWGRPTKVAATLAGVLLLAASAGALILRNGPLEPFIDGVYRFHALKGEIAPELELRLVAQDRAMALTDLRGQVVVLNLWASWCAPCVGELPDLAKLDQRYRDRGARVLAVSTQEREELLGFARERRLPELTGSAPEAEWIDTAAFLPFTLMLDRDGRVRSYHFGSRTYEEFSEAVELLL